jgi:hypothetical protein
MTDILDLPGWAVLAKTKDADRRTEMSSSYSPAPRRVRNYYEKRAMRKAAEARTAAAKSVSTQEETTCQSACQSAGRQSAAIVPASVCNDPVTDTSVVFAASSAA